MHHALPADCAQRDLLPLPGWGTFLAKLAAALVVLSASLWFALPAAPGWTAGAGMARVLRLSGVVGMGIVAYFAALFALGFGLPISAEEP